MYHCYYLKVAARIVIDTESIIEIVKAKDG